MSYPHKRACLWKSLRQRNRVNASCGVSVKKKTKTTKKANPFMCNQHSVIHIFSKRNARKILCAAATSRSYEGTMRRWTLADGPPSTRSAADAKWRDCSQLRSSSSENPCKCSANCASRRCPALIIDQALRRGKAAVGRRFRVFPCVCPKLRRIRSSQRRCQHGARTLARCNCRAAQTHANEKHS